MIASECLAQGEATAVNQVLTRSLDNREDNAATSQLFLAVTEFMNSTSALPIWADEAKIAMAEALFLEQGPLFLLTLTCASLPECYINGNEAQVLGVTNRLRGKERSPERVYETAQLIVDVLAPGAFTSGTRKPESSRHNVYASSTRE